MMTTIIDMIYCSFAACDCEWILFCNLHANVSTKERERGRGRGSERPLNQCNYSSNQMRESFDGYLTGSRVRGRWIFICKRKWNGWSSNKILMIIPNSSQMVCISIIRSPPIPPMGIGLGFRKLHASNYIECCNTNDCIRFNKYQ